MMTIMMMMTITKWFDEEYDFFLMCLDNISFDSGSSHSSSEWIWINIKYLVIHTNYPTGKWTDLAVATHAEYVEITDYRLVVQVL